MQKSRKYYLNEALNNHINNKYRRIINSDNYGIAFVDPILINNHHSIHTKINHHKVNSDNNGNYFIYAEENINPNLRICILSCNSKRLYTTPYNPTVLIKEEKKESNSADIDERHIYFDPTVQQILETQYKDQIENNPGRNLFGIAFGENEDDAKTLLHTTNILKDQYGYYVTADEEVNKYPVFVIYDAIKRHYSEVFKTKPGLLGDFIPLNETTQIMAKKYKIFKEEKNEIEEDKKEEKDEIKEDKKENENNINKINFEINNNVNNINNIKNDNQEIISKQEAIALQNKENLLPEEEEKLLKYVKDLSILEYKKKEEQDIRREVQRIDYKYALKDFNPKTIIGKKPNYSHI